MIAADAPEPPGLQTLQALVRDCVVSGVARRVLLLRVDLLPPRLSRPHHLRLARAALDPLGYADRARTHDLPGGRVAVSWRGDAPALLQQTLAALGQLLQDSSQDAPPIPDLVRLYDLPRDGDALRAVIGGRPEPSQPVQDRPATVAPAPRQRLRAMDVTVLSTLEHQLATADMARFARRRPVCRLAGDRAEAAWDKRYLSVAELGATVAPECAMTADPWLFRRLTRVLDRRLMALLSDPSELDGARPFSLGLNVGSVLSPDFLRFDAALPPGLRGRVILEMLPADIIADPVAFAFARDFARARSYRVLLRGVTAPLLPLLCVGRLELDYVQLRWSAALESTTLPPPDGTAHWVLSQAHEPLALQWGQAHGIGLFAGRAVPRASPLGKAVSLA